MKSIAIVADSAHRKNRPSDVAETIKRNVLEVFKSNVIVNNYYMDTLEDDEIIDEDLILVMAGSRAIKIKNHVTHPNNIIVAKRTFLKSSIQPLFSIPQNTDLLVVNDDIETVLDSISSLYHIGVKHVNLIPFEAGKDYHHIKYAVSPSEPELVPEYIENKFNVGSRVVDTSTMLLIISTLQLNDKETQQGLYNYYQKIFSSNEGIQENYNNLLTRTEELDYIIDLSHDGILLTDITGKILIYNKQFKDIFNINNDVTGSFLHEVLSDINPDKYYDYNIHDDLIIYMKKYINLEKKTITHFNKEIRMYFCFQEVTYIKKLEQNLTQKLRLKGQVARYTFDDILSNSKQMELLIEMSKKIAETDLTVLITGESGTGKEVLAQAIHNASNRKNQPFIAINGAAIPDNLLESELFGYESGSFTGALKSGKKGLFERANNGTIFLDEIGDMPNHLQSKLLRVLEENQIAPIGSDSIIDVDVRIIAATHKNPSEMIKLGSFRKDLFYRLNVFQLELPPLRNRPEDIYILINHFTNNRFSFTSECLSLLEHYDWPGNIRELSNTAKYICTLEENSVVNIESLPAYIISQSGSSAIIDKNENLILEQKADVYTSLAVLKSIQLLNEINKTAGRKHLLEMLIGKKIFIQESYLRKILLILNSTGLIITKKGRSGSYITEKGYKFLSENYK